MNLFQRTLRRENVGRPPVWFMRQAGRYHSHYQGLKKQYSFMELCKLPHVACEAAMGPIRDFDFDAAILFSDLLFPLEVMGMGLTYDPGPKLEWHLRSHGDLKRLHSGAALVEKLNFQAQAMKLLREELPKSKGLLGFVGGPFTLFAYAVEGSHQGELTFTKEGVTSGLFAEFSNLLRELLAENMAIQYRAGADTIAVLDTCAGEVDSATYREYVVPELKKLFQRFHELCPGAPITYYSKKTGPEYWVSLSDLPISCLGVDWKVDLCEVLMKWSSKWAIQGNVDPEWLLLPPVELENRLRELFRRVKELPASVRKGWVCGLGHGVLQKTPEANIRLFLSIQREIFG